jgi:hypothetical protein
VAKCLTVTIRCSACVRVLAVYRDVPADGSADGWLRQAAEDLRDRHRAIHPACKGRPTFATRELTDDDDGLP